MNAILTKGRIKVSINLHETGQRPYVQKCAFASLLMMLDIVVYHNNFFVLVDLSTIVSYVCLPCARHFSGLCGHTIKTSTKAKTATAPAPF